MKADMERILRHRHEEGGARDGGSPDDLAPSLSDPHTLHMARARRPLLRRHSQYHH